MHQAPPQDALLVRRYDNALVFYLRIEVVNVSLERPVAHPVLEVVILHFLKGLVRRPAVVSDSIDGGHLASPVSPARAMNVDRLVGRIVYDLEEQLSLLR